MTEEQQQSLDVNNLVPKVIDGCSTCEYYNEDWTEDNPMGMCNKLGTADPHCPKCIESCESNSPFFCITFSGDCGPYKDGKIEDASKYTVFVEKGEDDA